MSKEAMELALEALKQMQAKANFECWNLEICDEAIKALEEALAKQEQGEPVAYLCENAVGHKYFRWKKPPSTYKPIALYTTPQQRKPLTFEQVEDCFPEGPSVFEDPYGDKQTSPRWLHAFARAIEAAHGIKE